MISPLHSEISNLRNYHIFVYILHHKNRNTETTQKILLPTISTVSFYSAQKPFASNIVRLKPIWLLQNFFFLIISTCSKDSENVKSHIVFTQNVQVNDSVTDLSEQVLLV